MSAKKKKKKGRIIIFIIEILLLLTVLAGLYIWSKYQKLNRDPDFIATDDIMNTDLDEETQQVLKGYTNIAVFGLDNRSNGNYAAGNSDLIMIASINNDTQAVKLVSVYRDTYLNTSDDGSFSFHKSNYAYNSGGVERAIKMLNRNFDLDIQDYVVVDFEAVAEAVDLLGGVEITIDQQEADWIKYYIAETAEITKRPANMITQPGTYQMDGVQATAYCRIRFTNGNDFKRAQRQREVLSKMVAKVKKAGPLVLNDIIDSVLDDVSTSFTGKEIFALAKQMFNYELVDTTGFPFKLCTLNMGAKGDVVVPCDLAENVTQLHRYLFNDEQYVPSNTVKSFSAEIIAETGKGIGDEEMTGVEADNYTNGSRQAGTEPAKTD